MFLRSYRKCFLYPLIEFMRPRTCISDSYGIATSLSERPAQCQHPPAAPARSGRPATAWLPPDQALTQCLSELFPCLKSLILEGSCCYEVQACLPVLPPPWPLVLPFRVDRGLAALMVILVSPSVFSFPAWSFLITPTSAFKT